MSAWKNLTLTALGGFSIICASAHREGPCPWWEGKEGTAMQSRFAKVLLCVGLFLLSLLLLSALVEGPSQAFAPAPRAFVENTALWPGTLGNPELPGLSQEAQRTPKLFAAPQEPAGFQAPLLLPCRDANGRVLQGAGYLDSAFVIFRLEAAAG